MSDARDKKKSTAEEYRKTAHACMDKAKQERKSGIAMQRKKGEEHKQCKEGVQSKFKEAQEACKKG